MTTYLYNGSYYSTTITKIALSWVETCCINSIWARVPFDLTYPWVCIKRTPFVIFNKQMLYYEYPLDTFFRFNGQMMCTFYYRDWCLCTRIIRARWISTYFLYSKTLFQICGTICDEWNPCWLAQFWCAFIFLKCLKFLRKDLFSVSHLSYKRSRQFSSYEIYLRINYDTKESYIISFKIRYKKSEAKYTKEWIRRPFWVNLVVLWMQTFDVSHDCPRSL